MPFKRKIASREPPKRSSRRAAKTRRKILRHAEARARKPLSPHG